MGRLILVWEFIHIVTMNWTTYLIPCIVQNYEYTAINKTKLCTNQ